MLKVGHYVQRPGRKTKKPHVTIPVAEELETVPGIPSNQEDVEFYSREYPLETMQITERAGLDWFKRINYAHIADREIRKEHDNLNNPLMETSRLTGDLQPSAKPTGEDVTDKIKTKAQELGFGEVGITKYDQHYTYQSKKGWVKYPHAICLAYEAGFESTQSLPSTTAEIGRTGSYRIETAKGLELAEYILSLGYHAQAHNPNDHICPTIPMFVQAGLGQLGANGQLLSPHFGSRATLMFVTTDAKVTYDQPIDYGIHRFCQICQVCVNRCPGRALMREKIWWRGVEKNKLIYKRCRPVMARYQGCAVCVKVCPIQKYGMKAVMEHYATTGQVLGKGTHDLEGYTFHDKDYLGPGELPTFDHEFFNIPRGTLEEHLLDQLKSNFKEVDNIDSPEGETLFKELKTKLVTALGISHDALTVADEESPDYITG